MNTTILARSSPAGFFVCPKLSNKQGEEHMNDIFENTETICPKNRSIYNLTQGVLVVSSLYNDRFPNLNHS